MLTDTDQPGSRRRLEAPKPHWHTKRLTLWLVVFCSAVVASQGEIAARDAALFRVGYSIGMFTDVNENDARAAVKAWGQTVAKERGIEADPEAKIFKDLPALALALRSKLVDAVGITVDEYDILSKEMEFAPVFVAYNGGSMYEEYVLLVHRDSRIENITGLKGRGLILYQNARACLAPFWLDTLLMESGFRSASEFFGRVSKNNRVSNVILPVFFRQNDACLTTRSSFETMNELNPQIGKQLKIIASSPKLVPAVFCLRADYTPAFKDQLLAGLRDLHKTPAGHQVLTIFHSEKLEEQPASVLQSARDLLAESRRIRTPSKQMQTGLPTSEQRPKGAVP
jgi:ABC-type phosphate/phosphonate transport system substrate-binding protein